MGGRNLAAGGRHHPGDNLGQVEGMHHPGGNQLGDNLDLEVDSYHKADRRLVVVRIRREAG